VHKAIRKAQKSFILPPDREVEDIEEVEIIDNKSYDASNPVNAEAITKKQNNKKELTKYLLRRGIPKQTLKQFADYCFVNGFDLKDEKVKERLVEDTEILDWLIDTFLNK
jgi:hypothetical protein